ncbi:MAG: metallophosphoesterase [Polyangiales bacterium]
MNTGACFVHTADWQIGLRANHVPGDHGAAVRLARYDAVKRIADVARGAKADFAVVAGDVFEHHALARESLQQSFEALRSFPCDVFLLPGNHDPYTPESLYRSDWWKRECPPHVKVLSQRKPLDVGAATLLPCPLLQRDSADPTAWLSPNVGPRDRVRVGVAHGGVREILQKLAADDELELHNDLPIDLSNRAALDYLALGDWHGRVQVNERTWYSGTPEPTRFKERNPGDVLVVEVTEPRAAPRVTPQRVATFTWRRVEGTLHTADDVAALERQLDELPDRSHTLVELVLDGHLDLTLHARVENDLLGRYRGIFPHVRVRDEKLFVRLTDTDIERLPREGWIGQVVERLRRGVEGYSADQCQEALETLHKLFLSSAGGAR